MRNPQNPILVIKAPTAVCCQGRQRQSEPLDFNVAGNSLRHVSSIFSEVTQGTSGCVTGVGLVFLSLPSRNFLLILLSR